MVGHADLFPKSADSSAETTWNTVEDLEWLHELHLLFTFLSFLLTSTTYIHKSLSDSLSLFYCPLGWGCFFLSLSILPPRHQKPWLHHQHLFLCRILILILSSACGILGGRHDSEAFFGTRQQAQSLRVSLIYFCSSFCFRYYMSVMSLYIQAHTSKQTVLQSTKYINRCPLFTKNKQSFTL